MRVVILTTILFCGALLQLPAAERPNLIILLADDLGWQDIGCYGGPVKTPALDALAAQGVRFTDFHAGASVCSPSRATLLTGRHHMRTGVYDVLQDSMHNAHLLERAFALRPLLDVEPDAIDPRDGVALSRRFNEIDQTNVSVWRNQ